MMYRLLIIIGVAAILIFLLAGCRSVEFKEYYESGQIKKEYKNDGMINWSDGEGKQLPFSNINISGVGL